MILHKLDAGVVIRRVELVRDVPAERAELAPFLHDRVQEGHAVQHRLPLVHVADLQEVLLHAGIRPLQTGANALRRLVREFNGHLKSGIGVSRTEKYYHIFPKISKIIIFQKQI